VKTIGKVQVLEAVRTWRSKQVAAALRERPEFVMLVDDAGRTLLHNCARRPVANANDAAASIATAKTLLKAGILINAVQPIADDGEVFPATALWYALAWGRNRPLASFLLKSGADPNQCMFALVYADDLASAKLVRRYGAAIDEAFGGETPLTYAVRHRRAKFAEWLLKEGADPNAPDRRGLTALHHAVRRRLPDSTLRALLKVGADISAIATDGTSVAQLATRAQRQLLGNRSCVAKASCG
jgi:ankyrin repeat protein